MKKAVIIPARFSSTRLPGKPLKDILGKPMVVRVCETVEVSQFDIVAVATDDERIAIEVENAGFQAVLTKSDHVSGTDRLQEAATKLGLIDDDVIINLQGDEPLMPNDNLNQVAQLLVGNESASVATLYEVFDDKALLNDPNVVKLVQGNGDVVLYFSRASIPYDRDDVGEAFGKRHVGLYAYRKSALDRFIQYPEGKLEKIEKLEQLRFMENGHLVVAQKATKAIPLGVDTPEDLEKVRRLFQGEKQ